MKKIEYKFVKIPAIRMHIFVFRKNWNDIRIKELEKIFNPLGREGWVLEKIHWWEGMAEFRREIED